VGGSVAGFFDEHIAKGFGQLVIALTMLVLLVLLARFMHRRGIFLKV
jgi:predicted acyltransferase